MPTGDPTFGKRAASAAAGAPPPVGNTPLDEMEDRIMKDETAEDKISRYMRDPDLMKALKHCNPGMQEDFLDKPAAIQKAITGVEVIIQKVLNDRKDGQLKYPERVDNQKKVLADLIDYHKLAKAQQSSMWLQTVRGGVPPWPFVFRLAALPCTYGDLPLNAVGLSLPS
jgi:hypothetical protein